jgi:hypothetical protein
MVSKARDLFVILRKGISNRDYSAVKGNLVVNSVGLFQRNIREDSAMVIVS